MYLSICDTEEEMAPGLLKMLIASMQQYLIMYNYYIVFVHICILFAFIIHFLKLVVHMLGSRT